MDKIAQRRSVPNWLREKINMPGSYVEGFFKPELDRVMTSLKKLDDRIRSVLTGKKIGDAETLTDGISAKDLLKSARTNFNRREYMAGVADLGRFHKKMFDITQDIDQFRIDVNKIHNKFLFEGVDEEKINQLREYMENKKAGTISSEYFIKEAGIMDFFYNIGTKRGRALAAWEKKYPKQTKELREWGLQLVESSQKLLDATISYLKQMATARAIRRPDDYIEAAHRIKGEFDKFDAGEKGFKAYYNNIIMPFLKVKDDVEKGTSTPSTSALTPDTTKNKVELGYENTPTDPTPPPPSSPPSAPITSPSPPIGMPPGTQISPPATPSNPYEQSRDTVRTPPLPPYGPGGASSVPEGAKVRVAHSQFYNSLEKLSGEDPRILRNYISKYASLIQSTDPEVAIELFAIVKQIRG